MLQYTGGTTGVAKGAMLSHGNIVANVMQLDGFFETSVLKVRVLCLCNPYPFITSMRSRYPCTLCSAHLVRSKSKRPSSVVEAFEKYQPTVFAV